MNKSERIGFSDINITGGFWYNRQKINREITLDSVRHQFEKTGRFHAFDYAWKEGEPNKPHIFWDSDIAKWLESAAFILHKNPDEKLMSYVESVIDCLERNIGDDGYFNSYFDVVEPGARWTRRNDHELYCAGHLIEAAVAYYYATGKDRFLKLMCRYADYIEKVFKIEKSAAFATPGHEELELALVKLYLCTKNERYLTLSEFFIDNRGLGTPKDYFSYQARIYAQDHLPVREQTTAEGHCVRACYLYSAMADIAKLCDDEALFNACDTIFDNISRKRMYITGGIGSTHNGERFTGDFDLPNATAYAETCAAISLAMFCGRMSLCNPDSKYADIAETALYNGTISGISLDGKRFFYENPLEINLSERRATATVSKHVPISQRVEVFGCSCCPPNVTRFIASIADYIYSLNDDTLFVHQYMQSEAAFGDAKLTMETDYPFDGRINLHIEGMAGKTVAVRIPSWCTDFSISEEYEIRKGYAFVKITDDSFTLNIDLPMQAKWYEALPKVWEDAGKIALKKGPIVYCAEGVDNENIFASFVDIFESIEEGFDDSIGVPTLTASGYLKSACECCTPLLYRPVKGDYRPIKMRFIPYYAFANRGESDMAVWVHKF
ncbi:MAG: glycoside hydrolase family 127 protein [Clostridia bacterium]|nr:glycoside hydrolase family 127 protein [Clostridia bacterium]